MSELMIVTDLDGTLLDHNSYSFDAAQAALDALRARGIPLVTATSKTRLETLDIQQALGIRQPMICENGAVLCLPVPTGGDWEIDPLAMGREQVLSVMNELREAGAYRFLGFADCQVEQIAAMTGLNIAQAALAAAREYSEPLQWQDSQARLQAFTAALAERGLQVLQGGRFLSVSGPCDKAEALAMLRRRYPSRETVVALGDSPNDASMLAAADIAVIVKSDRAGELNPVGPRRVIRTEQRGPAGWQEAILAILAETDNQ